MSLLCAINLYYTNCCIYGELDPVLPSLMFPIPSLLLLREKQKLNENVNFLNTSTAIKIQNVFTFHTSCKLKILQIWDCILSITSEHTDSIMSYIFLSSKKWFAQGNPNQHSKRSHSFICWSTVVVIQVELMTLMCLIKEHNIFFSYGIAMETRTGEQTLAVKMTCKVQSA